MNYFRIELFSSSHIHQLEISQMYDLISTINHGPTSYTHRRSWNWRTCTTSPSISLPIIAFRREGERRRLESTRRFELLRWHRRNSTRENSRFRPPSLVKLDFDIRRDLRRGESQRHGTMKEQKKYPLGFVIVIMISNSGPRLVLYLPCRRLTTHTTESS